MRHKIYCDGGTKGSLICLVCEKKNYIKRRKGYSQTKPLSNNELEYLAMIYALEYVIQNELKCLLICSDSKLVVNQLNGRWKTSNPAMRKLYDRALIKLSKCDDVRIKWVPRDFNLAGLYLEKYQQQYFS